MTICVVDISYVWYIDIQDNDMLNIHEILFPLAEIPNHNGEDNDNDGRD